MRNLVLALVVSLVSASAFAGRYAGPLLVKATGEIAHSGEAKVCKIYHNHPALDGKLGDVIKLIDLASSSPVHTALHVRAQVPSIEVYGVKVVSVGGGTSAVKGQKVLLVEDHSVLKTRAGDAAEELIQLTEELCK